MDDDKAAGSITLGLSTTDIQENAGATPVAVTVTLSPIEESTVVVLTATIDGAPHSSTTVTVPPSGTNIGSLIITPTNDEVDTSDESVVLTAVAEGYRTQMATITIVEDDIPARTIALEIAPASLIEGTSAQNVVATLTLTPPPSTATVVTVNATSGGFVISSVNVTVNAGAATGTGTLSITPVEDPDDQDQIVTVSTAAVPGYGTPEAQTLTIEDNDKEQAVTLTINPDELAEDGDAQTVSVSVMLEHAPGTTDNKTATVTASSGGITFATATVDVTIGSGLGLLKITPLPDADANHETVIVTASYMIGTGDDARTLSDSQTLTIVDTQGGPVVGTGEVKITANISEIRENARERGVLVTAELPSATE